MAKFTLNIETDDVRELQVIVGNIAGGTAATPVAALVSAETEVKAAEPVAEKPKAAPKAKKTEAVAAVVTSADPVVETAPQVETAQATTLTPPPAAPTASYDQVKEALIALMDVKSASAVQALLKDKFGVIAISQMKPEQYGEALTSLQGWVASA